MPNLNDSFSFSLRERERERESNNDVDQIGQIGYFGVHKIRFLFLFFKIEIV